MKKINYGKIHDYAQCRNCHWDGTSVNGHKRTNLLYQIKKHIDETGHSITRETGTSAEYTA